MSRNLGEFVGELQTQVLEQARLCTLALAVGVFMIGCRSKPESSDPRYHVFPVGQVHKDPAGTAIEIDAKHADALLGLEQFSHVIVLYWFHENDTASRRSTLRVHPRGSQQNPLTGVFATRSPRRPNLIALSVCKVRSVEGNVVHIDAIDAFDGSPVLDLKPYIPGIDAVPDATFPNWVK